jgi:SAM-dependent methyltransferase
MEVKDGNGVPNRYEDPMLVGNYDSLLTMMPAHPLLRIVTAQVISHSYGANPHAHVLDLGCGKGHSAEYIVRDTYASVDLVDESADMLKRARNKFRSCRSRVSFICQDALQYLQEIVSSKFRYDAITASWVIHNFPVADQIATFRLIHQALKPGGVFVLLDKIYPDGVAECERLYVLQMARYRRHLPVDLATAIIAHEEEDASAMYRMDERLTLQRIHSTGFTSTHVVDRVGRDAVIVAKRE